MRRLFQVLANASADFVGDAEFIAVQQSVRE